MRNRSSRGYLHTINFSKNLILLKEYMIKIQEISNEIYGILDDYETKFFEGKRFK